MTDAKKKKVDEFLLASSEDLKLLVNEKEQQELLKEQRKDIQSSITFQDLESL